MKKHTYLIVAIDDEGGSIEQFVRGYSEQEAEQNFRTFCTKFGMSVPEIVEIKLIEA